VKARPAKSLTADLFAAVEPSAQPSLPTPKFAPEPAPRVRPREVRGLQQLWYAAVFPQLMEGEPSTRVLQRLCLHAQSFTSFVSIEAPNALLLEIKGSLTLLGPLETLHASIDARWRGLALPAHSATAPSTLGALWFARSGQSIHIQDLGALSGHMAKLPIACTGWNSERLQTLRSMGVTRMGELLRLPRAGLARRLGTDALRDLDIAMARQPAPRRAFVARERFRERCDFESEIETVAYLQRALEPLVGRCAQFLRERQAGVQTLYLTLRHRVEPVTRVHLGLASVSSERHRLMDVLTQKLERLELSAPIRSMALMSGSLQPLSATSLDVFATVAGSVGRDTAPQLVERLRARLGEEAVYGVVSVAEHRPEAAWRRVRELRLAGILRVEETRAEEQKADERTDPKMPRPVWLLDMPLPLKGGLILQQGPERIESGWWDGKGVARDYYVARQAHGATLWVFQERQSKRWYLHGVFA
jgi:protein ImuB